MFDRRHFLKGGMVALGLTAVGATTVTTLRDENNQIIDTVDKKPNAQIGIKTDKGRMIWQPCYITLPGVVEAEWYFHESLCIIGGKLFIPAVKLVREFPVQRVCVQSNDTLKLRYEVVL